MARTKKQDAPTVASETDIADLSETPPALAPEELARIAGEIPPPPPQTGYAAPEHEATPQSAPPPPTAQAIPTKMIVTMAIAPAFKIMAPNWNVSATEIDQLAEAYAAVLDKYFPDGIGAAPEFAAIAVTAMVFAPRVMAKIPPRAPVKPAPEKEAAPAPEAAPAA